MPHKSLNGLRVAILATDNFEEAELLEPRQVLDGEGAETVVISPKSGPLQAVRHDQKTQKVRVDLPLAEARAEDFDALLIPGGALNADNLRVDSKAQDFVRQMDRDGKPIAIICHGPWLLVSAGLVRGRKLTSYHTIQDDIRNAGGQWLDREVVRDGNWVTSRQPSDIPAFNREMVSLFAMAKERPKKVA